MFVALTDEDFATTYFEVLQFIKNITSDEVCAMLGHKIYVLTIPNKKKDI